MNDFKWPIFMTAWFFLVPVDTEFMVALAYISGVSFVLKVGESKKGEAQSPWHDRDFVWSGLLSSIFVFVAAPLFAASLAVDSLPNWFKVGSRLLFEMSVTVILLWNALEPFLPLRFQRRLRPIRVTLVAPDIFQVEGLQPALLAALQHDLVESHDHGNAGEVSQTLHSATNQSPVNGG
ncbi:MAG: hypothetical protein R3C19_01320 [Planctomycetaceae bacterium]